MTTTFEPVQHEQPMDHRARYGDREFHYHLRYMPAHHRRSIRVHVHPNGTVQVDAPEGAPLSEIKAAVQRRARWVLKHLDDIEERNRDVLPRQWVSGESVLYLGRRYVLKTIQDQEQSGLVCKLISGQLRVYGNNLTPDRVQKAVWKWYQEHALVVFQRRLNIMIETLPWTKNSPPWRMMEMQTQWGSCSPAGTVLLNPHLIKAPIKAIDYVLLHELCHLVEHNHSSKFYALLNQIMPDWRSVKERLDGSAELILTPNKRNR